MIQLLYNKNSVDVLNFAHPYRHQSLYNCIKKVEKLLQDRELEKKRLILGTDAVLEVCGLGKAKFLEIITDYQSKGMHIKIKRANLCYKKVEKKDDKHYCSSL